jgi:hypothetical protein
MNNMRVPGAGNAEVQEKLWKNAIDDGHWPPMPWTSVSPNEAGNNVSDIYPPTVTDINYLKTPGVDQAWMDTRMEKPLPAPSPRPQAPTAADMLSKAATIVAGDRNVTHGDKRVSFTAIAAAWEFYLKGRKNPDGPVRPQDVSIMMERLKELRAEYGQQVEDHWLDGAAYIAIAGELSLGEGASDGFHS